MWGMKYSITRRPSGRIYIRIHDRGKTRYVSTGIVVSERGWSARTGTVRSGVPGRVAINDRLRAIVRSMEEASAHGPTLEEAVNAARRAVRGDERDLFLYFDDVADGYRKRGQFASHQRLTAMLKKARAYAGRAMTGREMTTAWLVGYQRHLAEQRRLAPSTVAKEMKALRTLVYAARREGLIEGNPYEDITISDFRAEKVRLTERELRQIEEVELEAGRLTLARDLFCASVYLAGMRFADLVALRTSALRESRLEYVHRKTGHLQSLYVVPKARALLERYADGRKTYVFPILPDRAMGAEKERKRIASANAMINLQLKDVAAAAGVRQHLTFHVARHTFADIARRGGWSIYDISKALGHASIKVTERYLAGFDQDSLDEGMRELFG